MMIKGRGGKRYKLSSEGRLLADACHLLCHDRHRIDASNVCTCSRCPQAQPNSVFDNFFVQDSLGRLYNTNGKPKAPAASAARAGEDRESGDANDDASTTRRQRCRIDSSLASQSPATVNAASKLSAANGGSCATASWIDDSSDSDGDDELAGWDIASSPEADKADEYRSDWTTSRVAAIPSYVPALSASRTGHTLLDSTSDEDNVTPQQKADTAPEQEEEDKSQTLALSDDDCTNDLCGNEDVTPVLSDSQDIGSTLKLPDKYGETSSPSPHDYPVASLSATPARSAQSLTQGGEATWSVRHSLVLLVCDHRQLVSLSSGLPLCCAQVQLGGRFQAYSNDLQPRLNLAYQMWLHNQDQSQGHGGNSVSPSSFISDSVIFQRHGVEYRILFRCE